MNKGLTSQEVKERQEKFGFNELAASQPKRIGRIALEVIKEPMFLLLLSCGVLYMILGDYKEGIILMSSILIVITITFFQYRKTERALEALKRLSSPRALVMRDGKETRIPGREVVPDDILMLHEGDRVPADAQIISGNNLTLDESLLTGESVPVRKNENATHNLIYSGTLVVKGHCTATAIHTGTSTQFGKIGKSLESIADEETRLQKEMKSLIKKLFIGGIVISVMVVVVFYIQRGNFINSLLTGLAASMAILPEEFPVVMTIFLALGAWRLSKKNVLTRKSSAIETLGSATILCTDKTGTITQNKMEVASLVIGEEQIDKENFEKKKAAAQQLIQASVLATPSGSIDPMDIAILNLGHEQLQQTSTNKSVAEYPLSNKLLAMSFVYKNENDKSFSVYSKGAPEAIIKLCRMTSNEEQKELSKVENLASQGYRVIGAATCQMQETKMPESQEEFHLTWLGLIALEDPIRPEVNDAVKQCRDAGVKVMMITGDYPVTAKSIGRKIGMLEEGEIITGDEITLLNDEELRSKIKTVSIVARVVPEQKLRIVQALKANGEIVAMTGDGVNDAPALKAAHIGVSMGAKGTDVARESSSLVLLDDNFASIVAAIRSGRRIFDNLQKAMSYIMAIHIPIIGLTMLPAFFSGMTLILLPIHIVFMELIIDPVCSIAFEAEQEERGIMKRKPRDPNEVFFGSKKILNSVLKGLLLLSVVLVVYRMSSMEGHTEGEIRAITFSTLIIGNVFLILTELSKTRSFLSVVTEKNHLAIGMILAASIILVLIITIPSFSYVFNFSYPGFSHMIPAVIGATMMLFVLELIKFIRFRKIKKEISL